MGTDENTNIGGDFKIAEKEFEEIYKEIQGQIEKEYDKPDAGIYFIYDKTKGELVYVGIGEGKSRDAIIRVWMHQREPIKSGNIGSNIKQIDKDKKGWDKLQLKEYITDNFSFRYKAFNDIKKLKEFEDYMIKTRKPIYNIKGNPRYETED